MSQRPAPRATDSSVFRARGPACSVAATSSGAPDSSHAICAVAVLILVEITVLALVIRPGSVATGLDRGQAWLAQNGWTLGALIAFAASGYALAEGVTALA